MEAAIGIIFAIAIFLGWAFFTSFVAGRHNAVTWVFSKLLGHRRTIICPWCKTVMEATAKEGICAVCGGAWRI